MNATFRTILKIFSNTLVALTVVCAFLLHGFQLFGITPYSVLSGSMESVYPTGSLIYVVKTDPSDLEINDIITFKMSNGVIATHRIIELVPDETAVDKIKFRTKGDENEIADGTLVDFDSVIGKPLFCIPYLGYFAAYITHPSGKQVVLTVGIAIIVLEIIISIYLHDKEKPNRRKRKINKGRHHEKN